MAGGCETSGTGTESANENINSPHVLSATGVDRGDTPAVWNAVGQPSVVGRWAGVDHESGPADRTGHAVGCFDSGPGPWAQT
jgi:hypothetical protein